MEIILLIIIAAEFLYILYQDIANRKEREKLQLKLISRNVYEYKDSVEPQVEEETNFKNEEDVRIPVEEASIEQILKAEDRT